MKNKVLLLLACTGLITGSESLEINGKVQYDGKAPRAKKLNMAADPICGKSHSGPVFNESFVINDEKYMKNVVVWINNPKHSAKIPESPVVLDQVGCTYVPHVTGIMKGQDMMIKNSDKTLHNIHSMSEVNSSFNFAMPAKSDPSMKNFSKNEDPFYIKCDVHGWMKAWVMALDHPYFAVTDENGNYKINNVPPGEYEIIFWQEKLSNLPKKKYEIVSNTMSVTVAQNTDDNPAITKADFIFQKPVKKKKK